jgi:hypothetical protein
VSESGEENKGKDKNADKVELRLGNVSHMLVLETRVDIRNFAQGTENMVEMIEVDDLSSFAHGAQEGLSSDKAAYLSSVTRDPRIKEQLETVAITGVLLPITERRDIGDIVYHAGCDLFVDEKGLVVDKIEEMRKKGVYGGEGRVSYFSTDKKAALAHGLGNFNQVTKRRGRFPEARLVLLEIDTSELMSMRNVFIDPESLLPAFEDEFGRKFIVHRGIPVSAIKTVSVFRYDGYTEK